MEFQSLELTVEDILNLHRPWITELYVQDKKTEVEIVSLLCERRLLVTLAQVRRCVGEWGLVQLPAVEDSVPSPSPTLSDDWEVVPSPPKSEASTPASHVPSDPAEISEYKKRPLPSLPTFKIPPNPASKIQKKRPVSTSDRLKFTCHHGPSSSDVHEVQKNLESIPEGISMIDRYAKDEQSHERVALGLDGSVDLLSYRRARHTEMSGQRHRFIPKARKRKLERKEDGPERKERKSTPPSPCDKA